MYRPTCPLPIFCSDEEVDEFVSAEVAMIGDPWLTRPARMICYLARKQFGERRCDDLIVYEH